MGEEEPTDEKQERSLENIVSKLKLTDGLMDYLAD